MSNKLQVVANICIYNVCKTYVMCICTNVCKIYLMCICNVCKIYVMCVKYI